MNSSLKPGAPSLCSVVIPTWRRARLLEKTLHSLAAQTTLPHEVVVVSDGEDVETRLLSERSWPKINVQWIFHVQNTGQAAARNAGASHATGDLLLFLDDDAPAQPDLVASHLELFRGEVVLPQVVYGKIVEQRREPLPKHTDRILQRSWEESLATLRRQVGEDGLQSIGEAYEEIVSFCLNCSILKADFLRTGGFCSKLRTLDEDMEFGLRLYRSGFRFVVEDKAAVLHDNDKRMTEYFKEAWYAGGQAHAVRVLELNQRNPQTRPLVSLVRGRWLQRARAKTFFYAPGPMLQVANLLERATNATGSRLLFGAWARVTRPAQYWRGAREAGVSIEKLRAKAGQPKCALMFHSLSKPVVPEERTYYLSPHRFDKFRRWMKRLGYASASISDWATTSGRKDILVTFDDGYDDLYEVLLSGTTSKELQPLVFLVSNSDYATNVWDSRRGLRERRLLRTEQIRELQNAGVQFGSHTISHPWLPHLNDRELIREVRDSKLALEDRLGVAITTFAYPYGAVDQRVRAAVAQAGYELAFTTTCGLNYWNDPLCQRRADVNENVSTIDFVWKLRTGYGVREWLAVQAHRLETGIPTRALRSAVKGLHRATRPFLPKRPSPSVSINEP